MDLPFIAYTLFTWLSSVDKSSRMPAYMSPGLFALGPGIFSHRGVTTTRLMLKKTRLYVFKSEIACERTEDGASQWQEPLTQRPQRHLRITINLRACLTDSQLEHPPISPRINFMPYADGQLTQQNTSKNRIRTADGFKLIPPESKVIPLPTKAMG